MSHATDAVTVGAIREARQAMQQMVLAYVTHIAVPVYSLEVAARFGLRVSAAYRHLKTLEGEGLLTSEFRPAVGQGIGRRYFWAVSA